MLNVSQRLSMQQKQSPQQVLLSTLLQMPLLNLEQRIKMELEVNPLLEEIPEEELEEETDEEEIPELKLEKEKEDGSEDSPEEEKEVTVDEQDEIDWDQVLGDDEKDEFRIPRDSNVEKYERPKVNQISLTDKLLEQLHMISGLSDEELTIGDYIIWNLNSNGYLLADLNDIAENLDVPVEKVEEVLKIIQSFDPLGIAARDLRECLLIQLREKNGSKEAVEILEKHYEDFKNKRFEKLADRMKVSIQTVKNALEEISKLNPKPGEGYFDPELNSIVPDVIVERVDDEFVVSLNDSYVPRLRINRMYRKMLANRKGTPKDVKDYIRKRLEAARWLINSIEQRRATILRVMHSIVEHQRDFFEKGPGNLKPMILKDIAEDVGMDISTISRVTNGKYVQTDFGVFELKSFFSEKMRKSSGEEISNRVIKDRIREIIENEDHKKPYNDDRIVEILKNEEIPIARRTVAKYREQMGIPVARLRRQI